MLDVLPVLGVEMDPRGGRRSKSFGEHDDIIYHD